MIKRKVKVKILQVGLFLFGVSLIAFTYGQYNKNLIQTKNLVDIEKKKNIKLQSLDNNTGDIFYNIEYSGFDLSGNRYTLSSEEAFSDKNNQEIVEMKKVKAVFYFKDNTELKIFSGEGIYNNKTLDMLFANNVSAFYNDNELYSEKAEYINSKNILVIENNIKILSDNGNISAEKLFFDIKNQTLDVSSTNDNKINTVIKIK